MAPPYTPKRNHHAQNEPHRRGRHRVPGMKRLFAVLAFAFAGLAAELSNPLQCTLIHTSRQHRQRKPGTTP